MCIRDREETEEEEEPSVSPVTEELDDSCFTETLAKIYICLLYTSPQISRTKPRPVPE